MDVLPPEEGRIEILNNAIDISQGEEKAEIKIYISENPGVGGEVGLELRIYTVNGRLMKEFDEMQFAPGVYSITWVVEDTFSSGLYLLHAKSNSQYFKESINKFVIIR